MQRQCRPWSDYSSWSVCTVSPHLSVRKLRIIMVVYDIKVGRCSQLNEHMKLYEYQKSRSLTDLDRNLSDLIFLNFFSSINTEANWSQISCGTSPWDGETKACSNGPGHMTMMAIIRDQIWPCCKIGQGQHWVIIWINLVVLEHPMLHTKFQGHRPFDSKEEELLRFLPYIAAILVMWPGPFEQTFVLPSHRSSIWNLTLIGPVVSEEKMFKVCGWQTYDRGLHIL